ncbi:hypothetical protein [Terribacillus saccharophilus]|uniref:hypothetical protein n=1 Tax=Terribacillus saccharophilus TaxID=361277 RepID=UPI000C9BAA4D|nr:hypothetical protein [Terribacillus goriensis]
MKALEFNNYTWPVTFLLFSSIFLQRIAITVGSNQIPLILVLTLLSLLIILLSNRESGIFVVRITLFFSFLLLTTLFMLNKEYSAFSYFYLIALYVPFLFYFNFLNEIKINLIQRFLTFILITSFIGIFQFVFQLIGGSFIDPLAYLSSSYTQQGYLSTYQISYDSNIMKSNGIFYLEPSLFSQFLAIGIVIEISLFKRWWRIIIYLLALMVTFSGTGILLLVAATIPILFKLKLKNMLLFLILGAIIFGLFASSEFGQYTLSRTQEYKSPNSSFSTRFINPYKVSIDSEPKDLLFGHGPGQADRTEFIYPVNFSVLPKLLYEYGLIPSILFVLFLGHIFLYRGNVISYSLLIMYLFLSGGLLQPQTVCLMLFLLPLVLKIDFDFNLKQVTSPKKNLKKIRQMV